MTPSAYQTTICFCFSLYYRVRFFAAQEVMLHPRYFFTFSSLCYQNYKTNFFNIGCNYSSLAFQYSSSLFKMFTHPFGIVLCVRYNIIIDVSSASRMHASNDTRAMFRITNRLLGRKCGNTLPNEIGGPAILADLFASHFTDKIDSIRCQIPMPSANVYNAHARIILSPLLAFQPASLEDVTSLIQNGKIKTSNIDPLPSATLKANTSILAPILRSIVNLSYESSTVPQA